MSENLYWSHGYFLFVFNQQIFLELLGYATSPYFRTLKAILFSTGQMSFMALKQQHQSSEDYNNCIYMKY